MSAFTRPFSTRRIDRPDRSGRIDVVTVFAADTLILINIDKPDMVRFTRLRNSAIIVDRTDFFQ